MTVFILKITLGNEAMCTCNDISRALYNVAGIMHGKGNYQPRKERVNIQDINGNTVGFFEVK